MAELSRASGVPVATIKYYRREGLLMPGEASAPTQAEYDQRHVDRLRLVRVLREVADLPISALAAVVEAIDEHASLHDAIGAAHWALDPSDADVSASARARADAVIERAGWRVGEGAPSRASLARALEAVDELGVGAGPDVLDRYVRAADAIAADELAGVAAAADGASRDDVVARVVVGTILFEHVLVALRRLAQEHHSAARFG